MVGHSRALIAPRVAPVVPPQAKADPKAGPLPPWTKIASPAIRSRTASPRSNSDQPDGRYDEYLLGSDGVKHYFSQKYDHSPSADDNGDDFTMDDLPAGSQARFVSHFVPHLCDLVGTLIDPLDAERFSRAIHGAIQTTWDNIFPGIAHEVKGHDDAVFYMVTSRIRDVLSN